MAQSGTAVLVGSSIFRAIRVGTIGALVALRGRDASVQQNDYTARARLVRLGLARSAWRRSTKRALHRLPRDLRE
jgi:hypothetical protein